MLLSVSIHAASLVVMIMIGALLIWINGEGDGIVEDKRHEFYHRYDELNEDDAVDEAKKIINQKVL